MSRRRRPEKREVLPDPRFGDVVLSKFMNSVMLDGKKSVAESIVYGALDNVEARLKKDPIQVFHDALNNVKPGIEVRSRRVGGATYQVPVEVRVERAQALAMSLGRPTTEGWPGRVNFPPLTHRGVAVIGRLAPGAVVVS